MDRRDFVRLGLAGEERAELRLRRVPLRLRFLRHRRCGGCRLELGNVDLNRIRTAPQDEVVPWRGHVGYAQDLWKSGLVGDVWGFDPTPENSHVFLCGNPLMITAMKDLLVGEVGIVRQIGGQIRFQRGPVEQMIFGERFTRR